MKSSMNSGHPPTRPKDPDAVSLGQKGGRRRSPAQTKARRLNMLKALIKVHPTSVKIRQELARLEREQAG